MRTYNVGDKVRLSENRYKELLNNPAHKDLRGPNAVYTVACHSVDGWIYLKELYYDRTVPGPWLSHFPANVVPVVSKTIIIL